MNHNDYILVLISISLALSAFSVVSVIALAGYVYGKLNR